jgi:hypothetical protein
MQNYIIISRTFAEITPESAEDGEFSETGFITEREEVSFSELVKLMKEHYQPSSSPNDGGTGVWYSTGFQTEDYSTGTESEECIHYHKDNAPNVAKYWKWAAKFAGHEITEG